MQAPGFSRGVYDQENDYNMTKHKEGTFAGGALPMRDTPYNKVDGVIVYAGQLDAPMPPHPMPQPAKTGDDFTPEMFIAQRAPVALTAEAYAARCIAAGAIRNGSKAEIYADAIYNDGQDAIVTAERYNTIFVNGWDNGKGIEGGYCPAKERTPERTQRITDQVRFAPNQKRLNEAFDASCYYSSELHYQLACLYGLKFTKAKTAQPTPTPEPRKQAEFSDFP